MKLASVRVLSRLTAIVPALAILLSVFSPGARASVYIRYDSVSNAALPMQYAPGTSVTLAPAGSIAAGSYQWAHNQAPIPGATDTTLTLDHLSASDSGNYELRVTSDGATETSNTLVVNVLAYSASSVDTTFQSSLAPDQNSFYVAHFSEDGSLVAHVVPGMEGGYVRILADGTLDAAFTFPATAGTILAGFPDGTLITTAAPYRLHADGTPFLLTLPPGFDANARLGAAAVQSDGKVLLAQGRMLARLNADGSTDAGFNYSTTLSALHIIQQLQLDSTGRIYVTAEERDPNSSNFPPSWTLITRLSAAGGEDAGFAHVLTRYAFAPGSLAVSLLNDGRIFLTGSDRYGAYLRRLKPDGTSDPGWNSAFNDMGRNRWLLDKGGRIFLTSDLNGIPAPIRRGTLTETGISFDSDFYPGSGIAQYVTLTPDGKLLVAGNFSSWDGFPTSGLARLRSTDVFTDIPPFATISPEAINPRRGETLTFTAKVQGSGPFTYQWLALDGQALPSDVTSPQLVITDFASSSIGRFQVRVTGPGGSVLSAIASATFGTSPFTQPFIANLSGRAHVGSGDDTAIAGLGVDIRSGARGLSVLVRGAGPALQAFGVGNALPNPVLNVYDRAGILTDNNDQWGGGDEIKDAATASGAFAFAGDSNDAALIREFRKGSATVQLTDIGAASGTGLIEFYRIPNDDFIPGEIINLSLRARTSPGEKVATAGFVISDPQGFSRPLKLLLRVVGPTLAQSGVAFPLYDPVLTLYKSNGDLVATNDNWGNAATAPVVSSAAQQVGAFALAAGSKDAALLIDLPAGVYSLQATGANGTPDTGVVLIEIYVVRD